MTNADQPPASQRAVGQTRSAGFQVGARRAMPIDTAGAWRLLTSGEGVRLWLGDAPDVRFEPGATYAPTARAARCVSTGRAATCG